MIAYVKGEIAGFTEDSVIVEVGGIGMNIHISSREAGKLPPAGSMVKLHTYTLVREDAFLLY